MSNIILVGNKNVGKTTLYNIITNSNEKIANVSGSTVEFKTFQKNNDIIVDLPGIDNFKPISDDEIVVNDYMFKKNYDQINIVLDSANISKSTSLLCEVLELKVNTNIVLHQIDQVKNIESIKTKFEKILSLNVFLTTQKNTNSIKGTWNKKAKKNTDFQIEYSPIIEQLIKEIISLDIKILDLDSRFSAIQLILENNYFNSLLTMEEKMKVSNLISKAKSKTKLELAKSIFIARKMFVEKLLKDTTLKIREESNFEKFINHILINKFIGPIIFILIVLSIYYISIELIGIPIQNLWVDFISNIGDHVTSFLTASKFNTIGVSLINDVAFGSLATIIGFVPMILSIYFFTTLLESTGYNYRASILFDNVFEKFGLDGRSIVAIMSGYGCNVPAVLATRTQKSKYKRIISILVIPFIPCVARIPMISIFSSLFFKKWHFIFVFLTNIIIIITLFLSALFLKKTKFKNSTKTLVIEYPKLRFPNLYFILKLSLKVSLNYISKIFTTLLLGALIVWFLTNFGIHGYKDKTSFISYLVHLTSWVFKPFNIVDDRFSGLLIVGFSVKELLLSTIPVLFHNDINTVLTSNLNVAQGFALLIFFILYTPCLSTYLTIKKEIGKKYANFSIIFSFIVAYIASYLIYLISSIFI